MLSYLFVISFDNHYFPFLVKRTNKHFAKPIEIVKSHNITFINLMPKDKIQVIHFNHIKYSLLSKHWIMRIKKILKKE